MKTVFIDVFTCLTLHSATRDLAATREAADSARMFVASSVVCVADTVFDFECSSNASEFIGAARWRVGMTQRAQAIHHSFDLHCWCKTGLNRRETGNELW